MVKLDPRTTWLHVVKLDHVTATPKAKFIWDKVGMFLCFLNGPLPASFCLFSSFYQYNINYTNWKSVDGVLGIRTCSCTIVGDTTELWRTPQDKVCLDIVGLSKDGSDWFILPRDPRFELRTLLSFFLLSFSRPLYCLVKTKMKKQNMEWPISIGSISSSVYNNLYSSLFSRMVLNILGKS